MGMPGTLQPSPAVVSVYTGVYPPSMPSMGDELRKILVQGLARSIEDRSRLWLRGDCLPSGFGLRTETRGDSPLRVEAIEPLLKVGPIGR